MKSLAAIARHYNASMMWRLDTRQLVFPGKVIVCWGCGDASVRECWDQGGGSGAGHQAHVPTPNLIISSCYVIVSTMLGSILTIVHHYRAPYVCPLLFNAIVHTFQFINKLALVSDSC